MAWTSLAAGLAKPIVGGLFSLFGGGKTEQQKLVEAQQKATMERSNQFWQQAQGQMGTAQNYFAPIAGGSRTAAMEALAPEVQGATQRMDIGRRSLLNLSSRTGGAAAMIDPYAKASAATNILMKARPGAAAQMLDMARTTGGWAGEGARAAADMTAQERWQQEQDAKRGAALADALGSGMKAVGDWWGARDTKKSGAASSSPLTEP
jgi:hypothetical protein